MGVVIRLMMNRHNARMNAFAVRQLKLESSDRVLEIGFGGGVALPSLIDAAAFVAGVDRSYDVIGWAQRRFSRQIKTGRAEFRQGNVESFPFNTRRLTKSARSTRSISGPHSMQALPRSIAFSNHEAASLSVFSQRAHGPAWDA